MPRKIKPNSALAAETIVSVGNPTTKSPEKTTLGAIAAFFGLGGGVSSTDDISEGTTNLYFTAARVRAVFLTGLEVLTNAAIEATDNILVALGKLQAQITGHKGLTNPHSATATPTASRIAMYDANKKLKSDAAPVQNSIEVLRAADIVQSISGEGSATKVVSEAGIKAIVEAIEGGSSVTYNLYANFSAAETALAAYTFAAGEIGVFAYTIEAGVTGALVTLGTQAGSGTDSYQLVATVDEIDAAIEGHESSSMAHPYADGTVWGFSQENFSTDLKTALSNIQNVSQNYLIGRKTTGSGNAEKLTAAEARTILNVADGATKTPVVVVADEAAWEASAKTAGTIYVW